MLLRSGIFMVGDKKTTTKRQVSMKLMASLAPAQTEIEAGVVAKADQNQSIQYQCYFVLAIICTFT